MNSEDVRPMEAAQYQRTMTAAMPWSLLRCQCGCSGRASHLGLADGACMMSGCELTVRRWVRDEVRARRTKPSVSVFGRNLIIRPFSWTFRNGQAIARKWQLEAKRQLRQMLAKPPRVEGPLRWDVAFLELGSGRALLRGEASGKREGVCRTLLRSPPWCSPCLWWSG